MAHLLGTSRVVVSRRGRSDCHRIGCLLSLEDPAMLQIILRLP